jgi:flagellin
MPPYIQGGIFMIIQHNISSMNANRQLGITQGNLQKSTEKLSSGYRINRAGDDAAGLAISEKMRGQIRGLSQASTNSEDGISLVQTAEGALQETQNIIQRMRELAVQSANDTNTDDDRTQIQKEITQLTNEVDRIATTSEFNTKKLLDGSQAGVTQQKDGSASVEGTFTNGMVSLGAIKASEAALVSRNDVIRITIQNDITAGGDLKTLVINQQATVTDCTKVAGKAITTSQGATMESINGYGRQDQTNTVITISEGAIKIANVCVGSKSDQLAISDVSKFKNQDKLTNALTISFTGFGNLKAGDVITISLEAGNASSATVVGKESLRLQVGANAGQEIDLSINSMKAKDLGIVQTSGSTSDASTVGQALDVTSQAKASLAIESYDRALQQISTERAKLGAVQNRLEHTISNLDTSEENLQSAESRIRDVDMADEMTSYSKSNILQQAGTSMLAQANQSNQTVLSLLS